MFGSENVKSISLKIDADPGGTGEAFFVWRAPRDCTVMGAWVEAEQTQNAGTATVLELQNWGTAGTAVKSGGTVVGAVGGTAVSARLTARTPAAGSVVAAARTVLQGEYLVLNYTELGTGWISGDRLFYQFDVVFGIGA